MGAHDPAIRQTAIPYYANVWGYNRCQWSDYQICPNQSDPAFLGGLANYAPGDLSNLQPNGTPLIVNPIRVLQPHFGNMIECNLNLNFTLASAETSRQLQIAIGTFSSRYTAQTVYTPQYLAASHKLITNLSAPYTISAAGNFSNNKLNLMKALYPKGNANFLEDAFVLVLAFDKAPSAGSGWLFTKFEITATMQMGLN